MKISEITDNTDITCAWGVEVDQDFFNPPASIKSIGLLWDGNGPASISDLLIDTVIAFSLSGAEVIVEVRPTDHVDHEYLLTLAGNAGFSVSLIPPRKEDELAAWLDQCSRFSRALLTVPNFAGHLYPVTGYITYLIMEMFAGADALTPTDPYTRQRFYDVVSEAWSDAAKIAMRAEMAAVLGGEVELKGYLEAILKAIQDEAKKQILDQAHARGLI